MKIVVTDANLVPHRDRFEAAVPPGSTVSLARRRRAAGRPAGRRRLRRRPFHRRHGRGRREAAADPRRGRGYRQGGLRRPVAGHPGGQHVPSRTVHRRVRRCGRGDAAPRLPAAGPALRRDVWATSVYDAEIPQLGTLGDAPIGFVGFGHIGQRAWNLFRAFGCTGAAVTGSGRVVPRRRAWSGRATPASWTG